MEKNRRVFLCCFCGLLIQSNRANLNRHEQLHSKNVKIMKCVRCGKTFNNKTNFWLHWEKQHGKSIMPDSICCHVKERHMEPTVKKRVYKNIAEISIQKNTHSGGPIDFHILNAVNLVHKIKVNINMQKTIDQCLVSDPFFGQTK